MCGYTTPSTHNRQLHNTFFHPRLPSISSRLVARLIWSPKQYPKNPKPTNSHEIDEEELESQKIKRTFFQLGLCLGSAGGSGRRGRLVYRARVLRPPALRARGQRPRKTYFDDEGNAVEQVSIVMLQN